MVNPDLKENIKNFNLFISITVAKAMKEILEYKGLVDCYEAAKSNFDDAYDMIETRVRNAVAKRIEAARAEQISVNDARLRKKSSRCR